MRFVGSLFVAQLVALGVIFSCNVSAELPAEPLFAAMFFGAAAGVVAHRFGVK